MKRSAEPSPTRAARRARRGLGAALAAIWLISPSAGRADAPTGIYALGSARDNPLTPLDERLAGIRDYDFVSGFTLRVLWKDVETAPGAYDFDVVDRAIQQVSARGQGLNLEILTGEEPAYVLSGASSTYVDHRGGTNPVPWDSFARQRQAALYAALGSHVVQGAGAPHALREDPTLLAVHAAPAGLNFGVRDLNGGIRSHPGYTQQGYVDAVAGGVAATAASFPDDLNYLAFFAFADGQAGTPVDEQIIERLAPAYNGPGQARLAFFVENLSDDGPLPMPGGAGTGNNLADWVAGGGETMMQALDSWLVHAADREPQLDSRNPATGIELAFNAFGTRFFELYVADLDGAASGAVDAAGAPLVDGLREWNARLTSLADFDGDGSVDAGDLARWKGGFGVDSGAQLGHGDADSDGDVDGADLLAWQRQAAAGSLAGTRATPEPAAGDLARGGLAAWLLRRRRQPK